MIGRPHGQGPVPPDLRLITFNVNRHLSDGLDDFCCMLRNHQVDVALLQDVGITSPGVQSSTQYRLRQHGYVLWTKAYHPVCGGEYSADETTKLQREALKRGGGRYAKGKAHPRDTLAIAIRSTLAHLCTRIQTGLDPHRIQGFTLRCQSHTYAIFNVYVPPDSRRTAAQHAAELEDFYDALNPLLANRDRVIIGGDWNAVLDPALDREPPRHRTRQDAFLENFLRTHSLLDVAAHHAARVHTYTGRATSSRIDAFAITATDINDTSAPTVLDPGTTDHSPLLLKVRVNPIRSNPERAAPILCYKTPDLSLGNPSALWLQFHDTVSTKLDGWRILEDRQSTAEADLKLAETIQSAAAEVFGVKKKRPDRKPHLSKANIRQSRLIKRIDRLIRTLRTAFDDALWRRTADRLRNLMGEYDLDDETLLFRAKAFRQRERRRLASARRKEERANFQEFCAKLDDWAGNRSSRAYKQYAPKSASQLGITAVQRQDGSIATDSEEIKQLVHSHFAGIFKEDVATPPALTGIEPDWLRHVPDLEEPNIEHTVTPEDVREFIRRSNRKAAPGLDGITLNMIWCLPDAALIILSQIITRATRHAAVPARWKSSILVMLHKRGNATDLHNKRAIALSIAFAKIAEGIMGRRFQELVESKGIMASTQFGFRWGRGCTEALTILDQAIDYAKRKNQTLYIAFFDAIKAFDSVNWQLLFHMLERSGQQRFARFVKELYIGTTCRVMTPGGLTDPIRLSRGILQGAVSSAFLFVFFINPLLRMLNESPGYTMRTRDGPSTCLRTFGFADDLNSLSESLGDHQSVVRKVFKFGHEANLYFSINKSEHIVTNKFHRNESVTVPMTHVHPRERQNGGHARMKFSGPDAVFRSLGIHRSINDRSGPHQDHVWPQIVEVCYNLKRKPTRPGMVAAVVDGLIYSLLRFAAPFVTFNKTWLDKVNSLVGGAASTALRCQNRFRYDVLFHKPVFGIGSVYDAVHAAASDAFITLSDPAFPEVASALWVNYVSLSDQVHHPPLSVPTRHGRKSMVATVSSALRNVDLFAAWGSERSSPLLTPELIRAERITVDSLPRGVFEAPKLVYEEFRLNHRWLNGDRAAIPDRVGRLTQMDMPRWLHMIAPDGHVPRDRLPHPPVNISEPYLDGAQLRFYLVPSAHLEGHRGDYRGGVGAFCPQLDVRLHMRPPSAQSVQHSCASAFLAVLRAVTPSTELVVAMPVPDVLNAVQQWSSWGPHRRQQHPFRTTVDAIMEALDSRSARAIIAVINVSKYNDLFGEVEEADVNPDYAWRPRCPPPKGAWRNSTSRVCYSLPIPPLIPRDRAVVHDAEVSRLYEGRPSEHLERIRIARQRQTLALHPVLSSYFNDSAHPATVDMWRTSTHAALVWRARANKLPTGDNLRDWEMISSDADCACTCGAPVETLRHMIYDCLEYTPLRDLIDAGRDLESVLGLVKENDARTEQTLDAAKTTARALVMEFISIWRQRNRVRQF